MSSSSEKKRKKKKTTTTTNPSSVLSPNPSLPNDLLLSCIARVSRLHYPTLALVSKTFRSLLTSPELYKTRSLLNRNETCLFVCLRLSSNTNPRWFTLCQKPNQTLTTKKKKKKTSGYVLAPIPIQNSPQAHIWDKGVVSVGSNIYAIGGPINKAPSSSVSILDCKSYTWHEAPKMNVERSYAKSNVVDGKIYVAGGCKDYNSSNWIEVFDTKTQSWELLLNPLIDRCKSDMPRSAVIDGKIYMYGQKGLVYKAKEDRWEALGESFFELGWAGISYCVIDNVLYCYCLLDGITWYDSVVGDWKVLKGLKGLPKFAGYCLVKLVSYGGKMAVLWDKYLPSSGYKNKVIWCAVIALERHDSEEMWGNVEWFDPVLTVHTSYGLECAVAASV